jgi:prepilin-type N-terminal cleavage/methylation domain-containing protein
MGTMRLKARGFTMIEMLVSMAIGAIVLGTIVQLFDQALKVTWVTSQRSELQQDFRASINLMSKDISMAGAGALGQQGLSQNSVALPVSATLPVYPCNTTTCNFINGAPVTYPLVSGARYLYSIIPGPNLGIIINGQTTDILTVSYTDANLALNCYAVTYSSATNIIFTLPAVLPSTCILPTGITVPQALNDPVVGLKAGDMLLFSVSGVGPAAIGVVNTVSASTCAGQPCYTVNFAAGDPGHINQPTVAVGSLLALAPPKSIQTGVRLLLITYYLDISPVDGVTPRLMRVQNGRTPAPVAENVAYLKFTFDVFNGGGVSANQASLPAGTTPAMITKVNITHMSMRSQLAGAVGYQGLDMQTSVAARNMTFQQEYPITGSAY